MKTPSKFSRFSIAAESTTQIFCPHMGSANDVTTSMAFPTSMNRCYASLSPQIVDIDKQRQECLTECYETCEIFQMAQQGVVINQPAFPEEAAPAARASRLQTIAPLLMLVLILLAAMIWWPAPGANVLDATAFGSFEQAVGATPVDDTAVYVSPIPIQEEEVAETAEEAAFWKAPDDEVQEALAYAANVKQAAQDAKREQAADLAVEAVTVPTRTLIIDALPDLHERFQTENKQDAEAELAPSSSFSPLSYDASDVEISPLIAQATGSDSLIIYQDPDMESELRVRFSRLEPAVALGRDDSSEWIKVRTRSGIAGWVSVADTAVGGWAATLPLVESASSADSAPSVTTALPAAESAEVADGDLILRSAPGANFKPVTSVDQGDRVLLLGRWKEGPWLRIRLLDLTEGWVEASALVKQVE